MAGSFTKGFTASKRARSKESPTPLASPPVLKATKVDEEAADEETKLPAFLRQSDAGKFAVGAYANVHHAASFSLNTKVW